MSALGSQTTVDRCPVHHGIKSELLTPAFQTCHGQLPPPAPSRNPLGLWLPLCWPQTYSGLPRLCLYTLAQLQGPSHLSARHNSRGAPLPSQVTRVQYTAQSSRSARLHHLSAEDASLPHGTLPLPNLLGARITLGSLQGFDTDCLIVP